MVKFVLLKIFVLLFSEFSISVLGKICSKNLVLTYKVVSFDPVSLKPQEGIRSKTTFIFVCCDGYREVSRNRVQPVCEPICKIPCGHGYCYSPNKCICDPGYMLTKKTCKPMTTSLSTESEPNTTVATTPTAPESMLVPAIDSKNSQVTEIEENFTCGKCTSGTCIMGVCKCSTGYLLTRDGECHPVCDKCLNGRCTAPYHCECLPNYSYDSETHQCKPLCNGKIYGCIRGTCIGYNQCRCDNGTVLHDNEGFICVDKTSVESRSGFNYLLLLLVPLTLAILGVCVLIVCIWRRASKNYLGTQVAGSFPEVRYGNAESEHSTTTKFHECYSEETLPLGGGSTSRGTIRRNGNVVIIST